VYEHIITRLSALSRPAPPAPRLAAYERLAQRAHGVQTEHRRLRRNIPLAEDLAALDEKAINPKVELVALPLVGTVISQGRLLRDMLDSTLLDVTLARRAAHKALVGPDHAFTSAMQDFVKYTDLAEASNRHIESVITGIQRVLDKLEALGEAIVATESYIPPRPNEPFIASR
jgi:hypothetical protein